jgi:pimeloyl-ACP methyl ester carboxylesterase
LSWQRQVKSDLAKEFRMITYDLRGHGNSDKPLEPAKYQDSKAWADEVQAVIEHAKLKRPVLVGWSVGGRVIADHLTIYDAAGLAGLNYVGFVSKSDPSFFGHVLRVPPAMFSKDLASNIAATRTFLHNCFEKQHNQDDFETMLAFNMIVPPHVRANIGRGTFSMDETLQALNLPVLVTQGAADKFILVAAAKHMADIIPGQALRLRRRRPRAVLGGCGAIQYRACSLCADGQQDKLMSWASHTYGEATVTTVNTIACIDTRAFRCCTRQNTKDRRARDGTPSSNHAGPLGVGCLMHTVAKILQGTSAYRSSQRN